MNPDKQECFGLYLFGAGYNADEDDKRKEVVGDSAHFCQRCPVAPECNDRLRESVKARRPDLVDTYDRLMREAQSRGVSELAASFHLSQVNKHPYAAAASQNFSQGRALRRKEKRLAGEVSSSAG